MQSPPFYREICRPSRSKHIVIKLRVSITIDNHVRFRKGYPYFGFALRSNTMFEK